MGPNPEVIFGEITFEFDALLFGHFWRTLGSTEYCSHMKFRLPSRLLNRSLTASYRSSADLQIGACMLYFAEETGTNLPHPADLAEELPGYDPMERANVIQVVHCCNTHAHAFACGDGPRSGQRSV